MLHGFKSNGGVNIAVGKDMNFAKMLSTNRMGNFEEKNTKHQISQNIFSVAFVIQEAFKKKNSSSFIISLLIY